MEADQLSASFDDEEPERVEPRLGHPLAQVVELQPALLQMVFEGRRVEPHPFMVVTPGFERAHHDVGGVCRPTQWLPQLEPHLTQLTSSPQTEAGGES